MKKKGLDHGEIKSNLKSSKWSSEQVRYVLRKYAGKRTGLAEIPIGKFLKKLEKKESPSKENSPYGRGYPRRKRF